MTSDGRGASVPRILLLMDHGENRRLLAEWLATRYTVLPEHTDEAVDGAYDLGILDGTALDRLADRIAARKGAEGPVFLPFLLVTGQRGVGLMTRHLWKSIDEVIHSPADKVELQARLEVLLRARRQAVALHDTAQRTLRESEERFRALAETVPGFLFIATPDGGCEYVNHQWGDYTGLSPESSLGLGWTQAIHPDDREQTSRSWSGAVRTGSPWESRHRYRSKDGTYRWFSARAMPVLDGEGRAVKYIGVITDVEEAVRAEEELKEAGRRKDEFLATLAHELRNPLAPIRNAVQIMRLAGGDRAAVEQSRSLIERQLSQMVRLVDDLLDVSRITRDRIELRTGPMELAAAVQSAVETSRPLIEATGQELTVTFPPRPIHLDADPARLSQVFSNLLNNAAKYSGRGGHIRLTAERQGSDAVVTVTDTGIGIAADRLPHVFDMFMQVDRSAERSHGGLGIGLTLVRQLVEMHGGSIEARSEGLGKGSEFVVRLPVLLSSVEGPAPAGREEGPGPEATVCRVLVVDDNVDNADSLGTMLRIMGNEVRTAHDGLEALDVAGAFRPDLVLMDIGMPKLNGYDAARRLREQPWGTGMVLVAMTGWGQDEDKRRAAEAGFDRHLVKPVDPAALTELLAGSGRATAADRAEVQGASRGVRSTAAPPDDAGGR